MDDNNPQQPVQAQAPTGGGPDSGVETEGLCTMLQKLSKCEVKA